MLQGYLATTPERTAGEGICSRLVLDSTSREGCGLKDRAAVFPRKAVLLKR
jgi:hypothetical protein